MVSARLLSLVCCPACRVTLRVEAGELCCDACGGRYQAHDDFVDLRPSERFSEQTKYLDESLHADARHETVSPPLLSASVRHRMLLKFLRPSPGDRVLDLGCGSGRVLVWNEPYGAYQAGIDASPFFAVEARHRADLALGDLRRLPFADGAFTKAYALDVFEHLSREALAQVLDETSRVLEPGGRLFVYSHVRRNSRLALGLRAINRVARSLERAGLLSLAQERLRKSDHINPLADIPDLERMVGAAGFRVARIRYYTPLLAGFVENIVVRMAERRMTRRAQRKAGERPGTPGAGGSTPSGAGSEREDAHHDAVRAARAAAKARVARGGATYVLLRSLTWLLRLDVVLWGRVRSGPFFALLVKERAR
jgi:SAM-dependent methyltransferase